MDTTCASAASLRASEGEPSWQVRHGLLTRDRLASVRFAIDDLELLAGRLAPAEEPSDADAAFLRQYQWPGGQTGHCELDRSRIFELGIDGLVSDIRRRLAGATGKQAEAYSSFICALEGLSIMVLNAAETAREAMPPAPAARKRELSAIAESCRRIAHLPPSCFRDAIQLLWLMDLAVSIGDYAALVVPGHIDRTLWPFYRADLARGTISKDDALVLIESLYLLINEFVPDSLAVSVMVGGRDAAGRDVTNDLSCLCLEALRRVKLEYPTVGVCWHEGTPRSLCRLAVDLIGRGWSNPAFFNDITIQRGLRGLALPPEEACNYINSTCVEITPVAASNVWVASPYFPLCTILIDEIAAQVQAGQAESFDEFLDAYRSRLAACIARGAEAENASRAARRQFGGKPLQSVFTRSCIERGRDIDDGGAAWNWVECSFVGMANLADSLHVIREEVFLHKRLTLAELKAMLDSNFDGREDERLRLLQKHAKYGNNCADVDSLVGEIAAFVKAECARHRMSPDGSPFVPGMFCWIMHERLGRECGATPDGRRACFPFADGAGPAQGREKEGPTAAILSTTSWDHSCMIGGLAYNMKFNASLFESPDSFDRLQDLIVTFLRRGGFETQINVVNRETLCKARQDPDAYRDLVVRIGGYTDYFTRLSPGMQDEVMMRTEFEAV